MIVFNHDRVQLRIDRDKRVCQDFNVYDWSLWRLKIAVRDLYKLGNPFKERSSEAIAYAKGVQDVVEHLQQHYDRDITHLMSERRMQDARLYIDKTVK